MLLSRLRKNPNDLEAKTALEFLTKFNNEFYRGVLKKGDPNALHNTPKLYKEVCDSRNAQRRDIISVARSGKSIGKKDEPYQPLSVVELNELGIAPDQASELPQDDAIIERIDRLTQLKSS